MTERVWLGVDPGVKGALAVIVGDGARVYAIEAPGPIRHASGVARVNGPKGTLRRCHGHGISAGSDDLKPVHGQSSSAD